MFSASPPAVALSRPRLKALTKWVRDELDLLVAREGPDILRPDDVLLLHETFIALRLSSDITALDLRATGIHRAVQDIAGVATRWPGRLCDDCDKIITIWTAKFGPLDELHPFLYGRGGRLEGIASVTEYSREALLKRWSEHCPEKIHPKRSHRLGSLGFRAGDWWINALFAHHAGIIGLEAVEGGTTFDKHGAYAVLLKSTGEVEASNVNTFTYRVPQWDKGKFRLTAATPRSRDPIRVLRSHSINSVWGPKAGVRYEGLYGVKGWSIRQAKSADAAGGQWKEGDIIFEVRFERHDAVPMEAVTHRPTATEVDDYTEYKRLRKQHRDGKRKAVGSTIDLSHIVPQYPTKAAPPIAPPFAAPIVPPIGTPLPVSSSALSPVSPAIPPKILRIRSGSLTTQKINFRHPHFDLPEILPHKEAAADSPTLTEELSQLSPRHATLAVPLPTDRRANNPDIKDHASNLSSQGSNTSSIRPSANIKEVAPWIDYEVNLTLPTPPTGSSTPQPPPTEPSLVVTTSTMKIKKKKLVSDKDMQAPAHAMDSPPISKVGERRKSGNFKNMTTFLSPGAAKGKDERKSIFVRSRNPMAKLFDGVDETEDDGPPPYEAYRRDSGADDEEENPRVHSPIPIRPFSPDIDRQLQRRHGIYTATNDPLIPLLASPKQDFKTSWLESLISSPKKVAARQTVLKNVDVEKDGVDADAEGRLRMTMEGWDGGIWRNPWVADKTGKKGKERQMTEGVAPDVIG